jgi:hypothetical protein
MIRPATLAAADYPVALKPTLGYEQQLYVSTGTTTELGTFEVVAPNSGVYTANAADNANLAAVPQELMAMLEGDVNCGGTDLVLTVTGLDQSAAALTATATFSVPAYSSFTERVFPKGFAVEVIPTVDGKLFSVITNVSIASAAAATGVKVTLFGVPSLSTYRKIGCKVSMNYDPKVPLPHAVQCGRDLSAFIKAGEIPVGSLEITAKIPTFSDGLARINGRRVTGLIKEIKEDKIDTMHIFLVGLIMTAKAQTGESVDTATLNATAMYEDIGIILAR